MKSLARWRWPSLHTRVLCLLVAAVFALPATARAAGCGSHRPPPPDNGFADPAALQHSKQPSPQPVAPCSGPTCSGRRAPAAPLSPQTTELKLDQRWAHPVALLPRDGSAPALPLPADEPLPLGGHPSCVYHPPR
jgi:hypothetical protein